MINANELRLDNWIDVIGGERQQVVQLRKQYVKDGGLWLINSRLPEHCLPIPLTPEILEKAGFVLTDDGISPYWRLVIMQTEVISIEDDWSFGLNAENESSSQGYSAGPDLCKYVHQLQNLYFALTGQELTLSL